jgi:hypothetical protein
MTQNYSGKELSCTYGTNSYTLWPSHPVCMVQNEFSIFKPDNHSFSGSASQKFEVKEFRINNSPQVDFIPVEVFSEFPNLVGMFFDQSNLRTINSGLLTKNFDRIEYLAAQECKLESIEQNAFNNLIELRWVRLYKNSIKSLHSLIFINNINLLYIDIRSNQINSINPGLFKNLRNLKYIEAEGNQCINKNLECETCTTPLSQSDLESEFSTCFSNCFIVDDCALKSGNIENLSQDKIQNNIDTLVSYGHLDKLIERNLFDELIHKGHKNTLLKNVIYKLNDFKKSSNGFQKDFKLEVEHQKILYKDLNVTIDNLQEIVKIAENSCKSEVENSKKILKSQTQVIEEAAKTRQVEIKNQLSIFSEQFNRSMGKFKEETKEMIEGFERTFKEDTTNALSSNLEKTEGKLEKIVENLALKFSEIKALMEVERMQWKLKEAEHTIEKQAIVLQMEKMRKEFAEKLGTREAALKQELDEKYGETINQKIEALKNELRDEFRP